MLYRKAEMVVKRMKNAEGDYVMIEIRKNKPRKCSTPKRLCIPCYENGKRTILHPNCLTYAAKICSRHAGGESVSETNSERDNERSEASSSPSPSPFPERKTQ